MTQSTTAHTRPATAEPLLSNLPLESFSISGAKPFWSASDCANIHREQAYALLTLLTGAYRASEGVTDDDPVMEAPITSFRPRIIADALEGIATLIALSLHATDRADSRDTNGSAAQ